jgi:hypothetical protein
MNLAEQKSCTVIQILSFREATFLRKKSQENDNDELRGTDPTAKSCVHQFVEEQSGLN